MTYILCSTRVVPDNSGALPHPGAQVGYGHLLEGSGHPDGAPNKGYQGVGAQNKETLYNGAQDLPTSLRQKQRAVVHIEVEEGESKNNTDNNQELAEWWWLKE